MEKWEYRCEGLAFNNFMDSHTGNNPNKLGAEGWEMCGIWPAGIAGSSLIAYAVYKRRIDGS